MLDATKLIPEELVPLHGRSAGWCSTATPTTSSPRPSRSRSCPANIVPGIDFTNDPLLQGRLFSYLDTQTIAARHGQFPPDPDQRAEVPVAELPARRPDADAGAQGPRQLRAEQPRRARRGWRAARKPGDRLRNDRGRRERDDQGDKLRIRAETLRRPLQPGAPVLPLADRRSSRRTSPRRWCSSCRRSGSSTCRRA